MLKATLQPINIFGEIRRELSGFSVPEGKGGELEGGVDLRELGEELEGEGQELGGGEE